jgi:hypothetical protein
MQECDIFSFLNWDWACIEMDRSERVNCGNICFPWAKYLWKGVGVIWGQAILGVGVRGLSVWCRVLRHTSSRIQGWDTYHVCCTSGYSEVDGPRGGKYLWRSRFELMLKSIILFPPGMSRRTVNGCLWAGVMECFSSKHGISMGRAHWSSPLHWQENNSIPDQKAFQLPD